MPIQTPYAPTSYAGDGITNAFPVVWSYQFATDLVVTATVVATGIVTTRVLGTDYQVAPVSNSPAGTGTVTTTVAVPVGTELTITRAVPLTQDTTWVANDPNPTTAIENAVDKLTMITQDIEQQIANLPTNGNIVTITAFTLAPVSSSQTFTVSSVESLAAGNTIQISTGPLIAMYGQITAITGLVLTVTTLAITVGTAGTIMPVGAAVQLASVPGSNSVQVADAGTASATMSTMTLTGQSASIPAGGYQVDLFVASNSAGNATVKGYINGNLLGTQLAPLGLSTDALLVYRQFPNAWQYVQAGAAGTLLKSTGTTLTFGLFTGSDLQPGTVPPSVMNVTNSPTVGYALTYTNAGQFTWANVGGSGVPGGGTTGQFLRGDVAFSNTLSSASGAGTSFQLTNTQTTTSSVVITAIPGGDGSSYVNNTSRGANDPLAPHTFNNPIIPLAKPFNYPNFSNANIEGVATAAYIRALGFRADASAYWNRINAQNAPASPFTLDLSSAAYYRFTGFANNVTFVLSDNSPAPTSADVYATDMYLEIVGPGAFTITWPANVTWANGASAPTLSTTGISIVRLRRRQGQTQWIGYLDSSGSNVPGPGTITAGSQFSGTGFIPINTFAATGTMSATTYLTGNGTWSTPTSAINAQQNGLAISGSPFSTINFTTNITATNVGGTLTVSAAGGGGGGGVIYQQQPNPVNSPTTLSPQPTTVVFGKGHSVVVSGPTTTISVSNGLFNIVDYGADPTGSSDSAAAINAAIAAATVSVASGGTVYIPAGQFKVLSTITVNKPVNIRGEGCAKRDVPVGSPLPGVSQLNWAGASSGTMIKIVPGSSTNCGGMIWENFALYGGSGSIAGILLQVQSCANSSFRNLSFVNASAVGLDLNPGAAGGADGTADVLGNHWGPIYVNVTNSSTGVGVRMAGSADGANDADMNHFAGLVILHNFKGLLLQQCDNNSFYDVLIYSNPATVPFINGVQPDVICDGTISSGITSVGNSIYHLAGNIQCINGAACAVYGLDCVDAFPGSPYYPPVHVDGTSYLTVINTDGQGFVPRGTYWYTKNGGAGRATPTYSLFIDDNFYSPIGGMGGQTNDMYVRTPAVNSGNPLKFSRITFV